MTLAIIEGDFEVHLTLEPCEARRPALQEFCVQRSWKLLHIELSRGAHPSQPMVTYRTKGQQHRVLDQARRTAEKLGNAGFQVVRVKLEAIPFALGVPQSDDDPHQPGGYFEHHVKLLMDGPDAPRKLLEIVERRGAHLSRNVFKHREDRWHERFVTLRNSGVGYQSARAELNELLEDLRQAGYVWLRAESEYCMFDSNMDLDLGWLLTPTKKIHDTFDDR
jgi:hypothetical protein